MTFDSRVFNSRVFNARDVEVAPPAAGITVQGHAPTVAISEAGAPPAGQITVTGLAPSLSLTLEAPAGQIAVEGHPPTLGVPEPSSGGVLLAPARRRRNVALRVTEGRIYVVALDPQLSIDSTYERELAIALA